MIAENTNLIELERYVSKMMLELGIPAHLRGYYYLREAVLLSVEDMELVSSVTKLLYPVIARSHKTTSQRVERAIRNAIEVSWERGNPEVFEDLFGFSRETQSPRPTNSEYIARIADKVRIDG
ncbi:MAG: sporulation initiation factor Spo0A C-terminal domain-containing protein [Lachnospiraceae bacterium]|nr:sporulation initiation factor Spo0A C-terminal domain-containing protein [Lachnospiraceae bacterium]